MVCAMALLAGPALGTAYAVEPGRPDPGGTRSGTGESSGTRKPGLEQIRKQIERLHDRAGSATDAYNAAEDAVKKQQKHIVKLAKRIDTTQDKLDALNNSAGAMARAQYRSGGMPDAAKLMLGDDPEKFLHGVSLARKGQQATRGLIGSLTRTRAELRGYAKDATAEWKKLEKTRKKKAAAKKKITAQLKQAKKIESGLKAEERERLRELQEQAAKARQAKWLESGVLKGLKGKASPEGRRAIEWATEQLGKDYVWGAEGPETFDCSGLTMRAWEAAGYHIPRTSQEQWKRLPRVPVGKMRPGDLIIYKKDASHVGIYIGDGALLHAPRTGRQITVEGAGTMPILGVVRPDK
ncbi:C40 family peptidase [Streptomyces sp. DW4-2]|uniref:C40 family peptidase n=2 Tax=Streptomyces spirodelae TaxID=2812904 RepID=A0ABS3WYV7_9ACTN|nr:C40 family peptidase [Streptomyces spirodelae]